ncbi:MAG TPA: MFS transporter [Candidatus Sulfotelmatobacter sp.]|nr:MFS transporter [Candidatus Sulfotelmatobacter sp.]
MSQTVRPRLLFVSACAGILVFGIVLAILGTVFGLPAMRSRLQVSLAQQGTIILLLYLGIFIGSLLVGPLIDHLGHKANLLSSSLIVASAMVLFAGAHSVTTASIAAILLGVGGGGLNTCTNVLVSDLYTEQRGPMLNLLGIFFGVGAMSIPLMAASIEGRFTIPQLFLFSAVLALGCTAWYALISFPPPQTKQAFSWRELVVVAKYQGVLLLAFILFCESGNEACIAGWTSTYVGVIGHSPRVATLILAAYWGALMLSRMLAARVLRGIAKSQLVLSVALLSLGGTAVLISARSLILLFTGTALIGLSYGPIFPTTLAIAGDRYTQQAGTVFGLLFSVALIGGMTFPWAVGQVSQQIGVRSGMVVPGLGAIVIVGLCIALVFGQHKSKIQPSVS